MKSWPVRWILLVMLLGLLVRIVMASDLVADPQISLADLGLAFGVGTCQDLLALLLLSGPLAVALLVGERSARAMLLLLVAVVLVVTVAELFFWWEFQARLNRLVFHYLLFPLEVATFLEEQFYVSLYAIPAFAVVYLTYRPVASGLSQPHGRYRRAMLVGVVLASLATLLWARPWEFSSSRRLNELGSNGYLGVVRAASIDESRWRGQYWSTEQPLPAAVRGRSNESKDAPLAVKHVVLIVEESFAGEVWTRPELRARYLPRLSDLMARSVCFDQVYSTGTRTTRGLEALLNGYPPLPGIALTQRPGYEHLPSLPRSLNRAGFHSVFVYGGWPGFSNFYAYWRALGYQDLTSRHDFLQPHFETSWGVADEYLFARVRAEMVRQSKLHDRVFLTTLTVSNHRPFDFPAGRVPFPAGERRSEYALAYADWALGTFLQESSADAWFRDTLFIVVADHGPRIRGDTPIPVAGYRVPLLFYSPAHLQPRRVSHLGSSMSVGVTLLDLLGLPNDEHLYGDNLLEVDEGLVPVEHDYRVGLLTRAGLTVLHRGGGVSGWRYQAGGLVRGLPDQAVAAQAAQLFGSAHERFYGATGPATDAR